MTHKNPSGPKYNPQDAASGPSAEVAAQLIAYATHAFGKVINITMVSTALINEAGRMYGVAATERAIKGGAP